MCILAGWEILCKVSHHGCCPAGQYSVNEYFMPGTILSTLFSELAESSEQRQDYSSILEKATNIASWYFHVLGAFYKEDTSISIM